MQSSSTCGQPSRARSTTEDVPQARAVSAQRSTLGLWERSREWSWARRERVPTRPEEPMEVQPEMSRPTRDSGRAAMPRPWSVIFVLRIDKRVSARSSWIAAADASPMLLQSATLRSTSPGTAAATRAMKRSSTEALATRDRTARFGSMPMAAASSSRSATAVRVREARPESYGRSCVQRLRISVWMLGVCGRRFASPAAVTCVSERFRTSRFTERYMCGSPPSPSFEHPARSSLLSIPSCAKYSIPWLLILVHPCILSSSRLPLSSPSGFSASPVSFEHPDKSSATSGSAATAATPAPDTSGY
mmetsp:Transcript_21657/g.53430  ORF Transcript_21657/g.53430 Transcript_21657/m.53430 type:complete len:304 (+) Transcript_21657:1482-2393(+)